MELIQSLTVAREAALARKDFWAVKFLTKCITKVERRLDRRAQLAADKARAVKS